MMRGTSRTIGLLACALVSARLASAQAASAETGPIALSLQEAFARALQKSLAIGRARAEVSFAQAQKRGALSFVLPRLTVNGSATRNSAEVAFGSDTDRRIILPQNDWGLRMTLSQPIFAGLREIRAYDQARLGVDSAREGARASEDAVLLQVATDYLAAVEGQALIEVENRNLDLARKRKQQAMDLYEAGEVTRVDVLRAETAIKAAERRVVDARQSRDVAMGRLRVDLVLDGDVLVREPEGEALPPLPDEATLVSRALLARGEVKQAQTGLDIARLEVRKQQGAYLPVITADAGFIRQRTTFPKNEYGFARLSVSVPVFQGGEVAAQVAGARERETQARLELEETRRRVTEQVRVSLLGLQAAGTNLALAEDQLASAQAEYDQVFDLYRSQEATAVDLGASEIALSESRRAVATGRLDRSLAELRVWFAAGSLKAAVTKEVAP